MSIEQDIKNFLVNTLKIASEPAVLDSDQLLVDGYGMDSAGMFEMILWLEDRFSVRVPPEDMDVSRFGTIRATADYVERLRAQGSVSGEAAR